MNQKQDQKQDDSMNDIFDFIVLHQQLEKRINEINPSNELIKKILEIGYMDFESKAPILQLSLNEKGQKYLEEKIKELNLGEKKHLHTFVRGATVDEKKNRAETMITEDIIFRFLKFHLGVIRRTGSPYLRELVAEDYLTDSENLGYGQAAKLINKMTDDGYLKYDQFGAFPGTGVTEKGKEYYKNLKNKLKKDD